MGLVSVARAFLQSVRPSGGISFGRVLGEEVRWPAP